VTIPKAVLVPVDASHFAEHALPLGLAVARRTGAPLHLALVQVPLDFVAPTYPYAGAMETQVGEDRERGVLYLEGLQARLEQAGVEIRPALLRGLVADALCRYVDEHDIGLVVMTTHGRGGLERAWLGSTTDSMVRRSAAPVLLIRPSDETREVSAAGDGVFRRMLVALDGSETAEAALAAAIGLGITSDASIVLIRATSSPRPGTADYLEGVANSAVLVGRDVETRAVIDREPASAILAAADQVGADLIVMGTHGRGGLQRMIVGSVADTVIRGTHRAVLVNRAPRPLVAR
jgi:nucleotide-binding universal stress UspA family protein